MTFSYYCVVLIKNAHEMQKLLFCEFKCSKFAWSFENFHLQFTIHKKVSQKVFMLKILLPSIANGCFSVERNRL